MFLSLINDLDKAEAYLLFSISHFHPFPGTTRLLYRHETLTDPGESLYIPITTDAVFVYKSENSVYNVQDRRKFHRTGEPTTFGCIKYTSFREE